MFDSSPCPASHGRILRAHIVAHRLGVSRRTVRWYAKTGRLSAFRIGPRIWFFREADVEEFRRARCGGTVVA